MFYSLLKACAARVILVEISFLMLLYGCQDTWSPALLPNPHHVPLFSICSCFLLSSPWSCQNESCVWSSSPGYLSGCVNAETCHLQSCSVLIWLLVPCCLCPVSLLSNNRQEERRLHIPIWLLTSHENTSFGALPDLYNTDCWLTCFSGWWLLLVEMCMLLVQRGWMLSNACSKSM